MKKIFTIASLFLFVCFGSRAQLSKGRILLGGSLSASATSTERNFGNSPSSGWENKFSVNPNVGVFISDRWVVGLKPGFTTTSQENDLLSHKSSEINYGMGLFARYYRPVGKQFSFFGEITGIDFGYFRNKYTTIASSPGSVGSESWNRGTYYNLGAFLGIGAAYFVTPTIAVEASLGSLGFGFTRFRGKYKGDNGSESDISNSNQALSFSFHPNTLNLGVSFYLGK